MPLYPSFPTCGIWDPGSVSHYQELAFVLIKDIWEIQRSLRLWQVLQERTHLILFHYCISNLFHHMVLLHHVTSDPVPLPSPCERQRERQRNRDSDWLDKWVSKVKRGKTGVRYKAVWHQSLLLNECTVPLLMNTENTEPVANRTVFELINERF